MTDVRFDERGLVPAVVQDIRTGQVLMLAYQNQEALEKTFVTGWVHFFSRSRNELWEKGATSGNRLRFHELSLDCDGDAVLIKAEPLGPTCHTGEVSCFYRPWAETAGSNLGETLGRLYRVLEERRRDLPEGSYTAKLFKGGPDAILKKIGEEAGEVIIAGKNGVAGEILWETADLFYHTLVLLAFYGLTPEQLAGELAGRRR